MAEHPRLEVYDSARVYDSGDELVKVRVVMHRIGNLVVLGDGSVWRQPPGMQARGLEETDTQYWYLERQERQGVRGS